MQLQEVQETLLSILKKAHSYCVTHGLSYCLADGTLLGAVRHKGFIPWDNDMDIAMPRADFQRFLSLTATEAISDDIGILHYTTHEDYHYNVIRIYDTRTIVKLPYVREYPEDTGLWVDVFPMDAISSAKRFRKYRRRLALNKYLQYGDLYSFSKNHSWKIIVFNSFHILFPGRNNKHCFLIDKYAQTVPWPEAEQLCEIVERGSGLMTCPVDVFEQLELADFEDTQFFIPKNPIPILEGLYGSTWNELPPENSRHVHLIEVTKR